MTKREKIITLTSGILIVGLILVAVFEYFTIIKTQKMLNDAIETTTNFSDSKIVWINPDTTVLADESNNTAEIASDINTNEKRDYVLNKNSKKIHSPECESAIKTLDKNKEAVSWTEDEYLKALDEGYSPCSICKAGR